MRDYELMVVIKPDLEEEATAAAVERVGQYVAAAGGEVKDVNQSPPWGRKRLAYPIQDYQEGYYALSQINLDPNRAAELDQDLRLNENVIRHLLVRVGE